MVAWLWLTKETFNIHQDATVACVQSYKPAAG